MKLWKTNLRMGCFPWALVAGPVLGSSGSAWLSGGCLSRAAASPAAISSSSDAMSSSASTSTGVADQCGSSLGLVMAQRLTCTASRGCSTACRTNRTSSAPATTCIDMRDDTTSTDRTPSAALAESMVCADSCTQVPSSSGIGSTGSKRSGVFMPRSVPAMTHCNNFNANQVLTGDLQ